MYTIYNDGQNSNIWQSISLNPAPKANSPLAASAFEDGAGYHVSYVF
jgi:hypothetical protein